MKTKTLFQFLIHWPSVWPSYQPLLALRPAWTGPKPASIGPQITFNIPSHQRGLALVDAVREKFGLPVLMGQMIT
jgi:hypothetical protein